MGGDLTVQAVKAMKVTELKSALQKLSLPTDGLKAVLLARLLEAIDKPPEEDTVEQIEELVAESASPVKQYDEKLPEPEVIEAAPVVETPVPESVGTAEVVSHPDINTATKNTPEEIPNPRDATAPAASIEMTEEQRLRELVKAKIKPKKGASAAPVAAPAPIENPPSEHLRIDNFQRPLNLRSLKQWLTEVLECTFEDEDIWLNGIKTHCYVDFPSIEASTAAIARLEGKRWPSTNQKWLESSFTAVSAKDAPTSTEAARRPGEWKHPAPEPVAHRVAAVESVESGGDSILGKRKSDAGPGALSMLKNAIAEASGSSSSGGRSREAVALERLEGSTETGFSTRRNRDAGGTSQGLHGGGQARQLGLDDFFRKTEVKPHLYWLPLSEDEVAHKKAAKLRAAAGVGAPTDRR